MLGTAILSGKIWDCQQYFGVNSRKWKLEATANMDLALFGEYGIKRFAENNFEWCPQRLYNY